MNDSGYIDPMALHRIRALLFRWMRAFAHEHINKDYDKYTFTIDDYLRIERRITKALMAAYKLGDKRKL